MKGDIAIIGISGVFPEGETLDLFYNNLAEGRDSVREVSDDRKIYSSLNPSLDYKEVAYIDRVDQFDHQFFRIPRSEAELIDPQQRFLLQLTCHAIENAGYGLKQFEGTRTGVYMSASPTQYKDLCEDQSFLSSVANLNAAVAGRISYLLNLHGPAMMIDTACSSSLVAIIEACKSLQLGMIDYGLAGGIRIGASLRVKGHVNMDNVDSPSGRSKAFDDDADGIGAGEGGGVVMLKLLEKAVEDNDHIYAVIKGYAINQDGGRTVGITAPSPVAQKEVITEAWEMAQVNPENIRYIEAHGTGTKLGDPIEIKALTEAFSLYTDKKHICGVSSLKSNIGHLDMAAGVASVIKAVLSIHRKTLFPSVHFQKPNSQINFEDSAIYVNTEAKPWEVSDSEKRIAGVSSFGIAGTNAHMILEENVRTPNQTDSEPYHLVSVSAKTTTALAQYLRDIAAFVDKTPTSLGDLAYTLNQGRSDYPCRRAFVAESPEQLQSQIRSVLETEVAVSMDQRHLVLLFSEGEVSEEAIVSMQEASSVFKAHYEMCTGYAGEENENVKLFAFQYALYHMLLSFGISTNNIIGQGLGNVLVSVILGKTTLEKGLDQARVAAVNGSLPDKDKLKQYLQKLSKPVCVEMGESGKLLQAIEDIKGFEAFTLVESNSNIKSLLEVIARLYQSSVDIDWGKYYQAKNYNKVIAPGYPFDKVRCWYKEPLKSLESDISQWFYRLQWVESRDGLNADERAHTKKKYLVFAADEKWSEAFVARARQHGHQCIQVSSGNAFKAVDDRYEIRLHEPGDYDQLCKSVKQSGIDGIIYFNYMDEPGAEGQQEDELQKGTYPQFLLAKAFHEYLNTKGFQFFAIVRDGHAIRDTDQVQPGRSASFAFIKSLMAEYMAGEARALDFIGYSDEDSIAHHIIDELGHSSGLNLVAYSNGQRYEQELQNIEVPKQDELCKLKDSGLYLITGGAMGAGLEVGKYIASKVNARLVIIGRTGLPEMDEWQAWLEEDSNKQSGIYERVANLNALKQKTIELHYYAADLSNYSQLKTAIRDITDNHGNIEGIFHAAGVPGDRKAIKDKSLNDIRKVLAPKVQGTINLDKLTEHMDPIMVLFSSVNSVVTMANTSAYAVANYYLDAYSYRRNKRGKKTVSINWPGWRETGMSYRANKHRSVNAGSEGALRSIRSVDAMNALVTTLELDEPNLIIADAELTSFKANPYFHIGGKSPVSGNQPAKNEEPQAEEATVAFDNAEATDTEKMLAEIWVKVLKLDALDTDDDFFDIGGHSLTGFQVINRIQEKMGVEIEIDDLFEYGTLRELAAYLDELYGEGQKDKAPDQIPVIAEQEYYEVTHGQRRLWIIDRLEEEQVAYNMPGATIIEDLDTVAFEKAMNTLVMRHESLRTTFPEIEGEPKQKINAFEKCGFELEHIDLRGEKYADERSRELARAEAMTPFNLEDGPLIRSKLLQVGDNKYVWLLTLHHIISDGWSMGVLVDELMTLYKAYTQGDANPLPPLRIQYKDYAAWQNNELESEGLNKQRQYWLEMLSGDLPVLELPTDFNRPAVKTYNGNSVSFSVEKETGKALQSLAQKHGASVFMVLLAAVNTLLYKYSGQKDIIIGSPIAGRNHSELENQIGFYLNTLALRNQLSGEYSFDDLLKQIKANTLNAFENQQYPFDRLVEDLNLRRDMSRLPLFDVMVISQNFGHVRSNDNEDDVKSGAFNKDFTVSQFDLTFDFNQSGETLSGRIDYNTDLFVESRIVKMAGHLKRILTSITENSQALIKEIDILTAEERKDLLNINTSRVPYPSEQTVHALFEQQVAKSPDKKALQVGDRHWSYKELNEKANQLASYLKTKYNIEGGELIALLVDRSEWMLIGMLGIMKAGAAYLPIDPGFPIERIKHILESSEVSLMLSESSQRELTDSFSVTHTALDSEWEHIAKASNQNPEEKLSSEEIAYAIYTSGSTGKPKGVEIRHRSVVNLLTSIHRNQGISGEDSFLAVTTYSFDISVLEIFAPITVGATVILADKETTNEPGKLEETIVKQQPTFMQATPSMWKILIENGWEGAAQLNVLCGGEALSKELGEKLLTRCSTLWNMYGPTETTIWSTSKKVADTDDLATIGRAIQNTEIYILDEHMNLVPFGVPGEIYIGGEGVAKGYKNRPELTAGRFVANPFGAKQSPVIYRTGDVGLWTDTGEISFLGRADNQVKVRGFRIELGEIESVLRQHKAIEDAVVLCKQDNLGDNQLVAYILLNEEENHSNIRNFVAGILPNYMVPDHFIALESFPLTANNKVDRNAFPDLEEISINRKEAFVEPKNETEQVILDIWRDILGIEEISVTDNFFEIGGHSLKAVRVLSRISQQIGLKIELKVIFKNPTIAQLAVEIEARQWVADSDGAVAGSNDVEVII